MTSNANPCRLYIDAGGSTTRVGLGFGTDLVVIREGASSNPASVGVESAAANLRSAIGSVWADRPQGVKGVDAAWCCTSTANAISELDRVAADVYTALPQELASTVRLWVTNDIVPLLVNDGHVAQRVIAICGTGTGFCALHPEAGRCVRASGHEYLLSDEGSGFDMGLKGLRVVMRAWDGRGPASALTELLQAWRGVRPEDLPAMVHTSPEPKVLLASFAVHVLQAAEQGDPPAIAIVHAAADELATGILAVTRRAALEPGCLLGLSGSNLTSRDHPVLRDRLREVLVRSAPWIASPALVDSPLETVARLGQVIEQNLSLADLLARSLPFGCFQRKPFSTEVIRHV